MLTKNEIVENLQKIKPALKEKYNLTELALFGSYARNEQLAESDIDILVDYYPKNYKSFLNSIDEIEALFPGVKIQAVIKGAIKQQYFDFIKNDLIYA